MEEKGLEQNAAIEARRSRRVRGQYRVGHHPDVLDPVTPSWSIGVRLTSHTSEGFTSITWEAAAAFWPMVAVAVIVCIPDDTGERAQVRPPVTVSSSGSEPSLGWSTTSNFRSSAAFALATVSCMAPGFAVWLTDGALVASGSFGSPASLLHRLLAIDAVFHRPQPRAGHHSPSASLGANVCTSRGVCLWTPFSPRTPVDPSDDSLHLGVVVCTQGSSLLARTHKLPFVRAKVTNCVCLSKRNTCHISPGRARDCRWPTVAQS
jgi:hypothetical protein